MPGLLTVAEDCLEMCIRDRNIDRPTMMSVLEDVFRSMLIKMYGSDDNYDIIINIDKGDFEIWRNREVVEDGHVAVSYTHLYTR